MFVYDIIRQRMFIYKSNFETATKMGNETHVPMYIFVVIGHWRGGWRKKGKIYDPMQMNGVTCVPMTAPFKSETKLKTIILNKNERINERTNQRMRWRGARE